jgi:hypothetical protein
MSCDFPLLELPPLDIAATAKYSRYGDGTVTVWHTTEKKIKGDGTIAVWNVDDKKIKEKYSNTFMVCSIMSALNQAATFFKDHHCPIGANYNQTWNHLREAKEETNRKKTKHKKI